ncbi:MAG: transcriptional regulator [Deltaproteobacteria bacterium]|nr:transcriptional regulator [Deltaproteobacteria bacterium]
MKVTNFLEKHPVFTSTEFATWQQQNGVTSGWTRKALLAHHCKQGHILSIRRGLYASVPLGADPKNYSVDPYLLTAKMKEDAVLAYHTALEFYAKAYSVFNHYYYQTSKIVHPTVFRGCHFVGLSFPKSLVKKNKELFGVKTEERLGLEIHVTSLERTLVDVLDRPQLGGGWEEIWRSLESVEYFDLELVIEYALLLGNATTIAKVGYFLEQHRETLMVEDKYLRRLQKFCPKQPTYLKRNKKSKLISKWNLIVPLSLVERSWEEESYKNL